MKVVIVAKTRMGSGACIGALTFEGKSLRLVAADRETNEHFNTEYEVGDVWEIETTSDTHIVPPHVENVVVTKKQLKGKITEIEKFIEEQMPPVRGGIDVIFGGLTRRTNSGALYIAEKSGLPVRSTMFWRPDQPLLRVEDQKRIRYRYPAENGGSSLTFVGFQEPLAEIPAGTFLRVSLAHWWRPEQKPDGELRCFVQLSGWFLDEKTVETPAANPTLDRPKAEKIPCEEAIPTIECVLQETFGYTEFRPLQKAIIENVLRKKDTLAVMPTGSGKSLCYQLPATLFTGLTVVVSPLIALMEDQVLELKEWGIPAAYLNGTLSYEEYLETTARVRSGEIKLLYAAPETLLRPETILLLENSKVDCLVIDEAHCISEWGHDFRPEYRQLAGLRTRLPGAVTLAVTATATKRVRSDIKANLNITSANEFIGSFDRKNLFLSITNKDEPLAQTRAFLDDHHGETGIIYCTTREKVDRLHVQLSELGYPALPYHAGMENADRRANQHRFRYEDGLIMVATVAFGMGINKSNLRFILHYDLPRDIESYYQQIGRAGRDGLPAYCLVLYSYSDIHTIRFFIEQESPHLREYSKSRLKSFTEFIRAKNCRRKPLLKYFGEIYSQNSCGACDNCLEIGAKKAENQDKADPVETSMISTRVNLTAPAQLFISSALETRQLFGSSHLIDVLRGSRNKKVLKFKHDQLQCHGAGHAHTDSEWQQLVNEFIRQGLLERDADHGSIKVTPKGITVRQGEEVWGELPGRKHRVKSQQEPQHNLELFEQLRALRTRFAEEKGVPPYVIFHGRSLIEMATYYPRTPGEFARIYGVGSRKVTEYAQDFLTIIQTFCKEHNVQVDAAPGRSGRNSSSVPFSERTEHIWRRYQSGESIEAITSDLGHTQDTILSHLQKAYDQGKPLRVDGLKTMSQLTPEMEISVLAAFDECGTNYLKPIFESMGENVTYDQLKLWRLIYKISTD